MTSYPSPSGLFKASDPFNGFNPAASTDQEQEYLASQPSGNVSPSESTLFGSVAVQFNAASELHHGKVNLHYENNTRLFETITHSGYMANHPVIIIEPKI